MRCLTGAHTYVLRRSSGGAGAGAGASTFPPKPLQFIACTYGALPSANE